MELYQAALVEVILLNEFRAAFTIFKKPIEMIFFGFKEKLKTKSMTK